jgi:hypothetical protein
MYNNEHQPIAGTGAANGAVVHHDEAHPTDLSLSERQKGLYEEVERPRLEVEHLLGQQKALQRTPQSNDLKSAEEVEDHEGDDASTRDTTGHRSALNRLLSRRRPLSCSLFRTGIDRELLQLTFLFSQHPVWGGGMRNYQTNHHRRRVSRALDRDSTEHRQISIGPLVSISLFAPLL